MPTLKYLTRDASDHRAKLMHISGYTAWVCKPELDGWWIPKLHSKNNAYVEMSRAEAEGIAGRTLERGELVRIKVLCDEAPGSVDIRRLHHCPMEARMGDAERRNGRRAHHSQEA